MSSAQRGRVALVGGGVRSGKSAFVLERARRGPAPRVFVATAEALDPEMAERIAVHREERGGAFSTIEEPIDLAGAVGRAPPGGTLVVDCLTVWLSNLLLRSEPHGQILERLDVLMDALRARGGEAWLVTNEVGMGVVPPSELGRAFRDLAGRVHQRVSGVADEIYCALLGMVLRLVPGPVEVVAPGAVR